ncbi:MAG: hypothetical protein BA863_12405 [Desulfovibrio sp. S3730MH75]|nr:MAG: hypothetical protein BA863_12405 [Desulfovibrio sp. S3730MH75]
MDRIKLSKFCIGLAAAIFFGAIFYLFTLDKSAVSAAITIVGTGIASFAGAFVAFKFEKNERINLKKSTDRKSLALLVKYFEDEKFFLNLDGKFLEQIFRSKIIKPLASSCSKVQMSAYDVIFILDYNSDLFSKVVNVFGVLEAYKDITVGLNESMKLIATMGNQASPPKDTLDSLESQYKNFQNTVKLIDEILPLFVLLSQNILTINPNTSDPAPQPTPAKPPA